MSVFASGDPVSSHTPHQKTPNLLAWLRGLDGSLPRSERAALAELLAVTLDRCPVHIETAGGLAPGHPAPYSGDYLLLETFISRMRGELLDREVFANVAEAKAPTSDYRDHYNHRRPHRHLGI